MRICGIVCEYNPFHNGHLYQINKIKELGFTHIVVVMSPYFVQRGDIAIFSKWTRTKAALFNGVDLVVELPTVFATSPANIFAKKAIEILAKLNVQAICFGSECDDVNMLTDIAKLSLENHVNEDFKKSLKQGHNFPAIWSDYLKNTFDNNAYDFNILNSPNNVLAIEYIKAIIELKINITPISLKRIGVNHDDFDTINEFASASKIRSILLSGDTYGIKNFVPNDCYLLYSNDIKNNLAPVSLSNIDSVMMYNLRTNSIEDFLSIFDVTEGLCNRLYKFTNESCYDDYLNKVYTKRYTNAKIRRICIHSLLKIHKSTIHYPLEYIRVLGANSKGMEVLSLFKKLNKESNVQNIKVTGKFADLPVEKNKVLQTEVTAQNIFSLASNSKQKGNMEYYDSPIIIKD